MSKILDAMRKESPGGVDFSFQLETLGDQNLFPPPPQELVPEFEQLANALLSRHEGTTGHIITFASTTSGEGSSFVSFNAARHLATMLNRKVAWVDANFGSPQSELAGENVSFRNLLQNPALFSQLKTAGNLVLVPNGDTPIKATDLLNSADYLNLLEQFQRNFFFTILDGPPILDSGNLAHLAEPTLGLVLVIESRRLKSEVILHGMDRLKDKNVNVLGTVLNKRVFEIPGFLYRKL